MNVTKRIFHWARWLWKKIFNNRIIKEKTVIFSRLMISREVKDLIIFYEKQKITGYQLEKKDNLSSD